MPRKLPAESDVIAKAEELTGLQGLAAVHKVAFERACWFFSYGDSANDRPYDGKIPREYWTVINRLDNQYLNRVRPERGPA